MMELKADRNLAYKILYALIIFISAFLVFIFEPVTGKVLTPQYGGGADIWTGCLLFFQVALFLGYLAAFFLNKLKAKAFAITYAGLFILCLLLYRFPTEFGSWLNQGLGEHPLLGLFVSLFKYAFLPMFILSTVSVTMQNWYTKQTGEVPYILYSVSNLGSFLALFIYPFFFEPHFGTSLLMKFWFLGFVTLGVLVIAASLKFYKIEDKNEEAVEDSKISIKKYLYWIGLSAIGTVILASYTTYFTVAVLPMPLIWSVFLGLYLLTFVLCFGSEKNYNRDFYKKFIPVTILLHVLVYSGSLFYVVQSTLSTAFLLFIIFFAFLMVVNGEIYKTRPNPSKLSGFYLAIAFGGALGGIFVNVCAPLIFSTYFEFPLANSVMVLFLCYLTIKDFMEKNEPKIRFYLKSAGILLMAAVFGVCYIPNMFVFGNEIKKEQFRNFYGVSMVATFNRLGYRAVANGNTVHGVQLYDAQKNEFSNMPLAYYSVMSAFDYVFQGLKDYQYRPNYPLNIGAIGLGTGTVASYLKENDRINFYEIDPKMRDIALEKFTYIKDSKGKVDITMGDARVVLEKSEPMKYDLMLVDAFTSDAVPVHLITVEAFNLYKKHVKDGGIILFHVSNRYLTLSDALKKNADAVGLRSLKFRTLYDMGNNKKFAPLMKSNTYFIVFMPDSKLYNNFKNYHYVLNDEQFKADAACDEAENIKGLKPFTDDSSSLVKLFSFSGIRF